MALKPFRFPFEFQLPSSLWASRICHVAPFNKPLLITEHGDFKMYLTLMEGDLVSNKEDSKFQITAKHRSRQAAIPVI